MGFGIIIPVLYPYGKQFGLTGETLGILIAVFSIAQFFATPVLGSLSDKLGRKPLLVISLAGTCISFFIFAEARNLLMLFGARILDGLTGGNVSVAQAMVSDSSTSKTRAKKFGYLGSAFGKCHYSDNIDHSEQGQVLGINQSYASIGQTLGPITAGFAAVISVHSIFFLLSFYILVAFLLSFRLKSKE